MAKLVYLATLLALVSGSIAKSGFLVTSPRIYRAGAVQKLTVHVVDLRSEVKISLKKGDRTIVELNKELEDTFSVWDLDVPEDVPTGSAKLEVTVVNKDNSSDVQKSSKEISIEKLGTTLFIQTDKPIYKPGETVRGRVIGVNADLTPLSGMVDQLYISNPGGVRMIQWNDLEFEDGIAGFELPLSQQPVLGNWLIKATAANGISVSQDIKVDKYVLPKFEVIITPPPFVALDSKSFTATVCAKYTYGKPVSGDVKISACVKFPFWHRRRHDEKHYCVLENSKMDGCYDLTLTIDQLGLDPTKHYYNAMLRIDASVTENATGIILNGTNEDTKIEADSIVIDFDPGTPADFKPGMIFHGMLNVRHPDNTPVVGETVIIGATSNEGKLFSDTFVASNGIVEFNITVPEGTEHINLKAEHVSKIKGRKPVKSYKYLKAWYSLSDRFIQILKPDQPLQVGNQEKIMIKSTSSLQDVVLHYIAVCKGNIAVTGQVPGNSEKVTEISFDVTQSMSPKCRLLVYYINVNEEVIADSMELDIETRLENQVSVTFSDDEVKPGQETELTVKAAAGSRVAVSAVDKSVYLLKAGNELTEDKVINVLRELDVRPSWYNDRCSNYWPWRPFGRDKRSIISPSSEFVDAAQAFNRIGVVVMSNQKVETRPCPKFRAFPVRLQGVPGPIADDLEALPMVMRKTAVEVNVEETKVSPDSSEPVKARTEFPETWIWFEEKFDNVTQEKTFTTKIPDTITTWYASAFAMSDVAGIGVSKRASINVFQPFFVSITMPYSVIRGEEVKLIATVFNYLKGCTTVKVSLLRSPTRGYKTLSASSKKVCICSNEAKSVKFNILPREIGRLPFTISIRNIPGSICSDKFKPVTTAVRDAVTRKLLVEPEGVRNEYTYSTFFCPRDGPEKKFEETVNMTLPDSVVDGSINAIFSIVGDIMGPSLSGLDNLLRLPTGCGEQNMLNFAPNIYVMQYLNNTKQLTDEIKEKATGFLRIGYQRELGYKRTSGSYSAFGNSDEAGSMWLTAFVVRSFAQARPFIFIDPKELEHSIEWMTSKQLPSGCFPQHGRILHKDMKGGVSSPITLTAFVVLAMLEAGTPANDPSVSNALRCIEQSLDNITDVYSTALLAYTYALVRNKDPAVIDTADKLSEKLKAIATKEDGLMYWKNVEVKKPAKPKSDNDFWMPPCHRAPSTMIEMTAYAMMSVITNADSTSIGEVTPIIRWISKQRNSLGGFSSTQDTCVALQALAQYAGKVYGGKMDLSVKVKTDGLDQEFQITDENSLVTNRAKIPAKSVPGEVEVEASGEGCALMQVDVSYNIDDVKEEPAFDLSVNIKPSEDGSISFDDTCQPLEMHICASWLLEDVSNMAVIKVKLVSGFEADETSLEKLLNRLGFIFKKYEVDGSIVNLYFNEISSICVSFTIKQTSVVKNTKPGSVTVYDYYDIDKTATTMYNISQTDCYGEKVLKDCPVCTSNDDLKLMKNLLCAQDFALRVKKLKGDKLTVIENYKPKSLSLKENDSMYVNMKEYCTCPQLYRGVKSLIFGKLDKVKDKVMSLDAAAVVLEWNKFIQDQFKSVLGKCLKE